MTGASSGYPVLQPNGLFARFTVEASPRFSHFDRTPLDMVTILSPEFGLGIAVMMVRLAQANGRLRWDDALKVLKQHKKTAEIEAATRIGDEPTKGR